MRTLMPTYENFRAAVNVYRSNKQDVIRMIVRGLGACCRCCGETEGSFLRFDHADDAGRWYRKQRSFEWWVEAIHMNKGFPTYMRLLCCNCQEATLLTGSCPHGGGWSSMTSMA